MKTNDLLRECYDKFVTPEIEKQVEQTCKMMDDCEEIINNEYADVEIHKPSFYEGFKEGVKYFVNSGINAPNIPIYIIQSNNSLCENTCIEFVTTNKDEAYKYFDKIFKDDFILYELKKWKGENCEILKVK